MPQRHVARSNPERINLYQQITDRIIADLGAGRVPWVQPWGTASAGIGMPHNAVSSRRYSGINVLTLWHAVVSRGFSNHAFLTFRQAVALGGSVRRGERGVGIIYTRRFVPSSERRRADTEGTATSGGIPFLKHFTVFSVDQCDDLPEHICLPPPPIPDGLILPHAEKLIAATGADFRIGGPSAFYSPSHDYVAVPRPDDFHEPINWHRTAFHELGHWTGHASRLGRDQTGSFGSKDYGREELIVRRVGANKGVKTCLLDSWENPCVPDLPVPVMNRLKSRKRNGTIACREKAQDNRAILRVASAASKAADYILACRDTASTGVDVAGEDEADGFELEGRLAA